MVNQGPLTCPTCGGSGRAGRPTAELDADGMFDGQGKDKCTSCDGTGKQKR
jgi:DnaJ-class molecular chaperone